MRGARDTRWARPMVEGKGKGGWTGVSRRWTGRLRSSPSRLPELVLRLDAPSDKRMKVLYVDGDGPFGGASRSLFEVVRAFPKGSVDPHFVAARGTALSVYRQVAKDVVVTRGLTRFDNTRY